MPRPRGHPRQRHLGGADQDARRGRHRRLLEDPEPRSSTTRRCAATSRSTRSATSPRSTSPSSRARSPARSPTSTAATTPSRSASTTTRRRADVSAQRAALRRRHHRRRPQRPRLRRLSRARGLAVCVLERRGVLGGAAVTEEFHPGFRNSTASYTVSLLNPKVIRDLKLAEHGLRDRRAADRRTSCRCRTDGISLVGGGLAATQAEVAKFSRRDAERLPAYYAMLDRVADVLRDLLLATPPNVGGGVPRAARRVEGRRSAFARSISPDSATCSTSSPRARATCSTAGSSRIRSRRRSASTRSSATSRARTRRAPPTCCCTTSSARSTASVASGATRIGGMGAITQAMAKECAARGVVLRTDAPVARVIVKAGRAIGRRARRRRGRRGEARRRQRHAEAAVRAAGRAGARARRFPRAHRRLPLRLGHVPHERRALRAARLHRAAGQGRAAASRQRHHHRAVARLHGARVLRCEDARLVAPSRSSSC